MTQKTLHFSDTLDTQIIFFILCIHPESTSGLSTPPTASTDTCDSGFTEFFSNKPGTSTQPTSRLLQKNSDSPATKNQRGLSSGLYSVSVVQHRSFNLSIITDSRDAYSTSDSDSDSKWKTDEVMQCLDDDSYDGSEADETDFRSKERVELSRINFRWIDWVSLTSRFVRFYFIVCIINSIAFPVSPTARSWCKSTNRFTKNLPKRRISCATRCKRS